MDIGTKPQYVSDRDAVHVAIISMTCDDSLRAGDRVKIISKDKVVAYDNDDYDGIVDPFGEEYISCETLFWVLLKPGTVVDMKHNWKSANAYLGDVPKSKPSQAESEAWLIKFVATANCPDFKTVIKAALGHSIDDDWASNHIDEDYLHFSGLDAHGKIPYEFWEHVENYTGEKCRYKPARFSCSC